LPPVITNQPGSQTVPAGANPAFLIAATGSGILKYQWRFGGTNLATATTSVLGLNNVQSSSAGGYSAIVSNNFGSATSSVALLSVTNPACFPTPTGLVGWWQAEGSAVDAISGNSGGLVGDASFALGKVGQAFALDGNGDGILLNNVAGLQLQDFTIEAWIKRSSTTMVSSGVGVEGLVFCSALNGYDFGLDGSGLPFFGKTGVDEVKGGTGIIDTSFHHLAVTKAGTNVVFYVDGSANLAATNYTTVFQSNTVAGIGFRGDTTGNSFRGVIDELGFFNRALSPAEVQSLYNSTSAGKCPTSLAWSTQPVNQIATVGANASFTGAVSGSRPVTYQWRLNGAAVNIATNSALSLTGVTCFQAGNYTLSASNATGSITSSNAALALVLPVLLTNGSFETGNAAGWILSDISSPVSPLAVRGAGFNSGYGFFNTAPTDGSYCLTHGFDGNGPGRIRAAFDVTFPPSPITLTFSYRMAWDMQNYGGATAARTFAVTIEPYGGGPALQTNTILTAAPGTSIYDTGNLFATLNLSAFSGRAVRVSFDANIPEWFTGPGFFQLDNVALSYLPVPPFAFAKSGPNLVLTWPVAFSNFTAQVATNLSAPIAWTTVSTNLIIRSATNASLTLPITPGNKFFRLRSL
jgi:hypothetical protein